MANHGPNISPRLHRAHWSDPFSGSAVLWLRARGHVNDRALDLQKAMKLQGLKLKVVDIFDVSAGQLAEADLIMLDGFERLDGTIETVLTSIRMEHRIPLVILTNGYSTEQLVTALTAGADAIWAVNIPFEVLLARCKAILRRAQSSESRF